jgi:hypothetical protein
MAVDESQLTVVAAEAPRTDAGAVVGRPLVRDGNGLMYVLRRVDESPPALVSPVSESELGDLMQSRAWIPTPPWKVRPGFLTLAMSWPFLSMIVDVPDAKARTFSDFQWKDAPACRVTYASREVMDRWMEVVSNAVLERAERRLFNRDDLTRLRSDVAQVLFLTNEREPCRLRTYLDLALLDREVLGGEVSPGVASRLRREFQLSDRDIAARVEQHGEELAKRYLPFRRPAHARGKGRARVGASS